MRSVAIRVFLSAVTVSLSAACSTPPLHNHFWFDRPELMSLEALQVDSAPAIDDAAADCTPAPDSWQLVPRDRPVPSHRGEMEVWRSPGKLHVADRSTVRLQLNGDTLPRWKEGRTLTQRSFLYSPGGFLEAGLYLALPPGEDPQSLALTCKRQLPRWATVARDLRDGQAVDPASLIRLQRMGKDARRAVILPAAAVLTLNGTENDATGQASFDLACREPTPDTWFEVADGQRTRRIQLEAAGRWQQVDLDNAQTPIRISRRGDDSDQCFVANPVWQVPAENPPPGVLVVIVDGLRADVATDPEIMPEFSRWAQAAFRFSRARVSAPWTRPSMTSMLTGLAPRQHGLESESQRTRLSGEISLLPEVLRRHGYATASFSANPWLGPDLGLDGGFNRLMTFQVDAKDVLWEARRWIEAQRGPWFAVVFLMDTHYPFHHREAFDRTSGNPAEPLEVGDGKVASAFHRDPEVTLSEQAVTKTRGLYLENVAYVDGLLGDFLTQVQALHRDSIVAVTADHGEAFGEHGDLFHGWNLYDELLRVPLVIQADGLGRGESEHDVSLRQLPATLLELTGIDDDTLPGPAALGGDSERQSRPIFASTRFRDVNLDAVILGRWKLIEVPHRDDCQLYDLATDPQEADNLCSERPDVRVAMAELLEGHRAGRSYEPDRVAATSEEVDAALRSLGYLD